MSNAAGPLTGVLEDRSAFADAVRLTPVPGTNGSTYVAYNVFNVPASGTLDNWLLPQQVPQDNGAASNGYSARLFDGDPAGTGSEILTTDGQTGAGASATVGWVFNYANGLLFFSDDFRDTLTHDDIYVTGFRYVGETVADLSASAGGGAPTDASFVVLGADPSLTNERVIVAGQGVRLTDNGPGGTLVAELNMQFNEVPTGSIDGVNTTFTLSFAPTPPTSLMLYRNGLLMRQDVGCDYTLSGSTITFNRAPNTNSNILATYVKP